MAFHPEDRVVASCSEDESIKLWNLDDGGLISTMRGEKAIHSLAFSPDGQLIATGEGDPYDPSVAGAVRIYCASTGQVKRTLTGHTR